MRRKEYGNLKKGEKMPTGEEKEEGSNRKTFFRRMAHQRNR